MSVRRAMRPGASCLRPGAIVGGAVRRSCFPDEIFSVRISVPGGCGGSFFPALTRGRLNPCVFVFGVAGGWRRDGRPPALILVPILSFARSGSCVSTFFRRSRRSRFSKFPGHFSSLVSSFPGRAVTWFRAHGGEVISLFSRSRGGVVLFGRGQRFGGFVPGCCLENRPSPPAASCRLLFLGRPTVRRMPPPLGRFRGRRLPAPSLGRAAVGLGVDFGSRMDSRLAFGAVPDRFRKMGHVPFPGGVVLRRNVAW